jgi:hypothetical protein
VLPVLLVTDPKAVEISTHFSTVLEGAPILDLRCRLVRTDAAFRATWADARNRVAAVLSVLAPFDSPVQTALLTVRRCLAAPGPLEDFGWLLPLLERWCKLKEHERCEFRRVLEEDAEMTSVVEMWRQEGRVEGWVEGRVEGRAEAALALLRRQLVSGSLAPRQALQELQGLVEDGILDPAQAQEARRSLGLPAEGAV